MSALDCVLADLIEADRECAYVTVKREPLESLIDDWAGRGDQISLLFRLLAPVQDALAQEVLEESAAAVARQRHAVRREFAARLKRMLRSAIADVGAHSGQLHAQLIRYIGGNGEPGIGVRKRPALRSARVSSNILALGQCLCTRSKIRRVLCVETVCPMTTTSNFWVSHAPMTAASLRAATTT